MARQRLLVTGVTGVLGSAFPALRGLYPHYEFVFAQRSDLDLTEFPQVVEFLRRHRIDKIMHLAALSGGIEFTRAYPAQILRDNLLMTLNVLEAARFLRLAKVVLTLSSGMYPEDALQPYREEAIHGGEPHASNYAYAFAKRMIEPALRAYRVQYGLSAIGVVPSGIFGENDNYNVADGTWIAGLIRRFCEYKTGHGEVVVWGDGSPLRELTYSGDMAKAYMWCLDHYDDAQILNVGSTQEYSIKDVAFMVADIVGVDRALIRFDETKSRGIHRRVTDNSRFTKASGFAYQPLRPCLERTIKWYKDMIVADPGAIRRGPRVRAEAPEAQPKAMPTGKSGPIG
ncbi:MAG: NAD-dependent epimerase/dehydratase family protein [Alphaproteobacteria bacterium]|nr:NAD-dependent epimerase/dehydratase family protein [Alphaproteobacteria bacterium]